MVDATVGIADLGRPCPAVLGCGGPYATEAGAPNRDLAAAKQMLAASGVDLRKPVAQLLVANDPTITPAGQVNRDRPLGLVGLARRSRNRKTARRIRDTSDPAQRKALATAIQQQVYDSVAYIPSGEGRTTSALGDWAAGALNAPMALFWNAAV